MGKFIITSNEKGSFQFALKSTNGRVILHGGEYKSKNACLKGIEQVRVFAHPSAKFNLFNSKEGEYFFDVRNDKGTVIGTSGAYDSLSSRSKGMTSLRNNASSAIILDFSETNKGKKPRK